MQVSTWSSAVGILNDKFSGAAIDILREVFWRLSITQSHDEDTRKEAGHRHSCYFGGGARTDISRWEKGSIEGWAGKERLAQQNISKYDILRPNARKTLASSPKTRCQLDDDEATANEGSKTKTTSALL